MNDMLLRSVVEHLKHHQYRFSSETQLHEAIAGVLESIPVPFEREVRLTKAARVDFLVDGWLVLEVKVDGSLADAGSQVARYGKLEQVGGVVLVTTCSWGRTLGEHGRLTPGGEFFEKGKPLRVLKINRVAF